MMKNNYSAVIVAIASYLTVFSYISGVGEVVQSGAIVLVIAASLYIGMSGGVISIGLSFVEVVFMGSCVFSILVAFIVGNYYSVFYGLLFFFLLLSFLIHSRASDLNFLVNAFGVVFVGVALTHLLFSFPEFIEAISVQVTSSGLTRYSPMGTHPNLVGIIYGGGVVYFLARAIVAVNKRLRLICLAASASFILVVMAASARGSLVAAIIVALFGYIVMHGLTKKLLIGAGVAFLVCFVILFLVNSQALLDWSFAILELDSDTRGIDSGGTGRTDLWESGINLLVGDSVRFFFGGGLRSAEEGVIGFQTENSYITILLEFGVFVGSTLLMAVFFVVGSIFYEIIICKSCGLVEKVAPRLVILMLVLFLVLQSVFNRYLIAIGNPFSLIVLFIVFSYHTLSFRSINVPIK